MAEAEKTFAAHQTELQDNAAGDISPEDLRNLMASAMGGYGGLKTTSGLSMIGTIGTTPVKYTMFDVILPSEGVNVIASAGTDLIVVNIAGDYEVFFTMHDDGGVSSAALFTFQVYVNGVAVTGLITFVAEDGATGQLISQPVIGGIITIAAGNAVEIRVKADAASKTLTAASGQFYVRRIR